MKKSEEGVLKRMELETVFQNERLFYDRRKNSYRRKGIPLDQVVGIAELAQSVAAILLQEPDHVRASPARYFKERKLHDKVFSNSYDIGVYAACARFSKTVSRFLHEREKDRGVRRNILFYVMMVAACLATKTLRPRAQRIAELDLKSKVTESLLNDATRTVMASYKKHGADDKASKGTEMLAELKNEMQSRFGRQRKNK